jgi:hypothetical protein
MIPFKMFQLFVYMGSGFRCLPNSIAMLPLREVCNPCTWSVESLLKAIEAGRAKGKERREDFKAKLSMSSIVPSFIPLKTRHAILFPSAILGMQNTT